MLYYGYFTYFYGIFGLGITGETFIGSTLLTSGSRSLLRNVINAATWPIFACAAVDLEKFCDGTPLTEINDAVDDGPVDNGACLSHLGRSTLVLLYTNA